MHSAEALKGLALPGLTSLALDGVAAADDAAFAFSALAHLTGLSELRLSRQEMTAVRPAPPWA